MSLCCLQKLVKAIQSHVDESNPKSKEVLSFLKTAVCNFYLVKYFLKSLYVLLTFHQPEVAAGMVFTN